MSTLSDQTANTKVDLDHFETFVSYAKTIVDYVHYDLIGGTLSADRWTSLENEDGNPFGGFDEARRMQQSVVETRNQVTGKVRELETRVRTLHENLKKIAEDYKSVDELNRADVAKIKSMLEAQAGPGGSPYQQPNV